MAPSGFAHSEIHGSSGYVPLTVAYRSLSRPSSASCAKASTVCPYHLLFEMVRCKHTLAGAGAGAIRCVLLDEEESKLVLVTLCGSQGTARASPRDRTLRAPGGAAKGMSGTGGSVRLCEACLSVEVVLPRKEVIQPHLPVRLPCYDFTPLTLHTFGASPPRGLGRRLRVQTTRVV